MHAFPIPVPVPSAPALAEFFQLLDLHSIDCFHAAWGDYDNDGDLDLALSGREIVEVIHNDDGKFISIFACLESHGEGRCAWGDYDNDGDLDLACADKIYRNDNGIFTRSAILSSLEEGDHVPVWGDYDNDGDLDIATNNHIFRNDNGVFNVAHLHPFANPGDSMAWGDYDNDGDLDLVVSGSYYENGTHHGVSKIYRNDEGTFIDSWTPIPNIAASSTAWGDYDNDGDLDIVLVQPPLLYSSSRVIICRNDDAPPNSAPSAPAALTSTVTTDGLTLNWDAATDAQTPPSGLSYNIRLGTSPGSSDVCSPMADSGSGLRRLYAIGNAQKKLSWTIGEFKSSGTYYWSVQAIDSSGAGSAWAPEQQVQITVNKITGRVQTAGGTGLADVIVRADNRGGTARTDCNGYYELAVPPGWSGTVTASKPGYWFSPESRIYSNLTVAEQDEDYTAGNFTDIGAAFPDMYWSGDAWGDYDNDGDLDLAFIGDYHNGQKWVGVNKIYNNDGGVFTDSQISLPDGIYSALAWGDYDNDGDLDLTMSGIDSTGRVTKIFRNDAGTFSHSEAVINGISADLLSWGDYDNDGDLDLAFSGGYYDNIVYKRVNTIYKNDNGAFADSGVSLTDKLVTSMEWGDCDNDGDLDLVLSGRHNSGYEISYWTVIYKNYNGNLYAAVDLGGIGGGAAWGDYDSDGDLDLAVSGRSSGGNLAGKVFRNDDGRFVDTGVSIVGGDSCDIEWGDFDNDGDLDLVVPGYYGIQIYINRSGSFVDSGIYIRIGGSLAWGDVDNDGDLDILAPGRVGNQYVVAFRNNGFAFNTAPSAPGGLTSSVTPDGLILSWNAATDAQTPSAGLSYNIMVGTSPGLGDIFSGMADPASGYRLVPGLGNAQKKLSWTLKNIPYGDYYWSVQAIDASYAGSPWASQQLTRNMRAVKKLADNDSVSLSGVIVSADFTDYFYVESDKRECGIRVEKASHGLAAGMRADIHGAVKTNDDGERDIEASTAVQNGSGSVLPVGVANHAVGGSDFGYQAGVAGGTGLNNIGLLVTVWGRVREIDAESGFFYLDDGSTLIGANGQRGLKVAGTAPEADMEGKMAVVTGVVSCFKVNGKIYPLILAKSVERF